MSLGDMIGSVSVPMGSPGSLFQNPAAGALGDLSSCSSGLSMLGTMIPGLNVSSLTSSISSTSSSITSGIGDKISKLSTELPICSSAANLQLKTQTVDAITSGNFSSIPDPITQAFTPPNSCSNNFISNSFNTITQSKSMVTGAVNNIHSAFDGHTELFSALNKIPGVNITDGKSLLTFFSSIPAGLSSTVSSAISGVISSSPSLLSGIQSSVQSATSHVGDLASSFASTVSADAASVTASFQHVAAHNTVNMITNSNPCIQSVMQSAVNPNSIDYKALAVQDSLKTNAITIPGQESVAIVNSGNIVKNPITSYDTSTSTTSLPSSSNTAIQYYLNTELNDMSALVDAELASFKNINSNIATYLKENYEDYKATPEYKQAREAAGATKDHPEGTSTDPAALAAYQPYRTHILGVLDYYNNTLVPQSKVQYNRWQAFNTEWNQRKLYGKYPYTYLASIGTPADQYVITTFLDTTT